MSEEVGLHRGAERELRILNTFCKNARHFDVQHCLGNGCNGIVFAVTCNHAEMAASDADKLYALKVGGCSVPVGPLGRPGELCILRPSMP